MEKFKRTLRLVGLIALMILASVGIGITGAVPVPTTNRKEETVETIAEIEEFSDDEPD